jgi:hypothetical protein
MRKHPASGIDASPHYTWGGDELFSQVVAFLRLGYRLTYAVRSKFDLEKDDRLFRNAAQ